MRHILFPKAHCSEYMKSRPSGYAGTEPAEPALRGQVTMRKAPGLSRKGCLILCL